MATAQTPVTNELDKITEYILRNLCDMRIYESNVGYRLSSDYWQAWMFVILNDNQEGPAIHDGSGGMYRIGSERLERIVQAIKQVQKEREEEGE